MTLMGRFWFQEWDIRGTGERETRIDPILLQCLLALLRGRGKVSQLHQHLPLFFFFFGFWSCLGIRISDLEFLIEHVSALRGNLLRFARGRDSLPHILDHH